MKNSGSLVNSIQSVSDSSSSLCHVIMSLEEPEVLPMDTTTAEAELSLPSRNSLAKERCFCAKAPKY